MLVGLALLTTMISQSEQQMPLLFKSDFKSRGLDDWTFSDAKAFELVGHPQGRALGLVRKSVYVPKVRSPLAYALLKKPVVGDFVLDVKVKSTVKDYGHRDLCLFFGFKNPEHFYYVHFAKSADPHAHSIFLVDGKPRISIGTDRTKGVNWSEGWHHLRLVRKGADIAAFFDDLKKPVMKARDETFPVGRVGVGSFDDLGLFDELELHGVERSKS